MNFRLFLDARAFLAGLVLLVTGTGLNAAEIPQQTQRGPRSEPFSSGVYKDRVTPHWFGGNTRFWYRNELRGGAKEFVVVDAERGTREPAFDASKLAAALSKAASTKIAADRLPFDSFEFIEDAKAI